LWQNGTLHAAGALSGELLVRPALDEFLVRLELNALKRILVRNSDPFDLQEGSELTH
jgi:hypothetical protein